MRPSSASPSATPAVSPGGSDLLLATHVGNEEFYARHDFPSRLVAPRHRGYGWVKWLAEVVSRDPAWLELPPPLQ
jgi:Oxidoreductase molybdopterin binding domain